MYGMIPFNRKNNSAARRDDFWDFGGFLNDFFGDTFINSFTGVHPIKADIKENEKEYIVDAEIPGVKKEDIKLDLRDGVLTISVEQNEERNEERDNYIRRERKYGSFSRRFAVDNVKHEEVSAKYNNGVLTINLPKAGDGKEKKHRIEIQ